MTQEQYIKYLKHIYTKANGDPLAESSISKYGIEAMRLINVELQKIYGNTFSLYAVEDIEQLKNIRKRLINSPNFHDIDNRGNRMYSAGFNRYLEFAEGQQFRLKEKKINTMDIPEAYPSIEEGVWGPEEIAERRKQYITTPNRDRIKIIQMEQACDYLCQVDPTHKTFKVASQNHQYMEGHHIIPLNKQDSFKYSLDCYANILVLCPTCHRFFHYAEKDARQEKLRVIFDDRAERLQNSGISIDIKDFLEAVDSRPTGKKIYY